MTCVPQTLLRACVWAKQSKHIWFQLAFKYVDERVAKGGKRSGSRPQKIDPFLPPQRVFNL